MLNNGSGLHQQQSAMRYFILAFFTLALFALFAADQVADAKVKLPADAQSVVDSYAAQVTKAKADAIKKSEDPAKICSGNQELA